MKLLLTLVALLVILLTFTEAREVTTDLCHHKNGGCSQICKYKYIKTIPGIGSISAKECSCKIGFKLNADGKSCDKVDPCEIKNGGCSQICKNYRYRVAKCSCRTDFRLNDDGKSCDRVCPSFSLADIGFLLDSSGSLKGIYQDEKNFLKSLLQASVIDEVFSHAGVVTFSSNAVLSIKLDQYTTQSKFDNAVDNIPHYNGFTRMDLALKLANDELFTEKNGLRPVAKHLCILITDGTQTSLHGTENPAIYAAKLRARGIKTITVGIGKAVNQAELARIAGNHKDAFVAANLDILKSSAFANRVKEALCRYTFAGFIRIQN